MIAATFHTQPSEIDRMTLVDLETWLERARFVNARR